MSLASTLLLSLTPLALAQESPVPAGSLECVAEWGPVASSVYPRVREAKAVAEQIDSGPRVPRRTHTFDSFRAFLPPPQDADEGPSPNVWDVDVEDALVFLRQLHPGATARMRHAHIPDRLKDVLRDQGSDPNAWKPRSIEGGKATLIASTAEELSILIRVHMEFELVPDEMYLLPAQFEGTLVWDRANDRPKGFHLALPPRNTNYDLIAGSVDIGYLPLMQVASAGAERSGPEADEARARLRAAFYPSDRIEWRTLEDALERANKNGRRLHVVQLFGTLDDESC